MSLGAALLLACERPGFADRRRFDAGTSQQGATDTVVHRIPRFVRHASAMQRVTGVVKPRSSTEPLDSILAIRVMDQRGADFVGARVTWIAHGLAPGGRLRVLNSITDSLGISRAEFTPGATANPQGPVAEVPGIGRIDFAVTVPVAAIRIDSPPEGMWADEGISLRTELYDSSGVLLVGGGLSWSNGDNSVARVRGHGDGATVEGVAAGVTTVRASLGSASAVARIHVRPVLVLELLALDGEGLPAPAVSVELAAGRVRDTIVMTRATTSERVDLPPGTDVELLVTPLADRAAVHPARVSLSQRDLRRLRIALIPVTWRVAGGSYAGSEVRIQPSKAASRSAGGAAFWHVTAATSHRMSRIVGWRESDLPLRLAFDRGGSAGSRISAGDSAAFWAIADQMERDLGMNVFEPAELDSDGTANVARVGVSHQESSGHAFVSWSDDGNAFDGSVVLRDIVKLRDAHVVTHELLHLLGFGHSMSWPTVSRPVEGDEPRLTADDVAHVQVALRLRRLQDSVGAVPGLPFVRR